MQSHVSGRRTLLISEVRRYFQEKLIRPSAASHMLVELKVLPTTKLSLEGTALSWQTFRNEVFLLKLFLVDPSDLTR